MDPFDAPLPFNTPDEIKATKGDLVEFKCRKYFYPYCHFAVYTCDCVADSQVNRNVGDGITVGVSLLPSDSNKFSIEEKTMRELCKIERGCRVNNLLKAAKDKKFKPYDAETIVERARDRLRKKLIENYYLLTKNCEHFATWCRYGKEFSCQADKLFLKPFIFMSTLWSREHQDPNHMIIEVVKQNEEKCDDIE